MSTLGSHLKRSAAAIAAAIVLAACADDTPAGPARPSVNLGVCQNLQAPAGSTLSFHAYARGVQVYRWSGTAWSFVEPSAVLYADAGGKGAVGTHFAGPTWLSNSGSKVVAAVVDRCTPDAGAIPWLLLGAVSAEGPGPFARTTHIQRVNTVGGNAPATPGSAVGELARVPYTAEYFFYRAR